MNNNLQALTAEIVAAYVANNTVPADELPALIEATYTAVSNLGQPQQEPEPEYSPAVNPRRSVTADHIVSLIDGRSYRTLKRHLTRHGLTPDQYRARYGLKHDYPMVAASYAARRSELAKSLGLGRKQPEPAAQNSRGGSKRATRASKSSKAA